jgi:hypothetical protein
VDINYNVSHRQARKALAKKIREDARKAFRARRPR